MPFPPPGEIPICINYTTKLRQKVDMQKDNYKVMCISSVQSKLSVRLFSQSLSRVRLFATPWTEALQASLSITSSQSLLSTSFQEVFSDSASKNLPTLDTRRITAFFVLEIVRKLSYLVPEEVLSISIL